MASIPTEIPQQRAVRRMLVVTPSFNAQQYIDEAILSVITQAAPNLEVRYHIQDGGSQDGTRTHLKAWETRINQGHVPCLAASLHFSYDSTPDAGMYDAINRGFARLKPQPGDLLTWINSDDCLATGAFATVSQAFNDNPQCGFLSGRVAILNQEGMIVELALPTPYTRTSVAAGLHDGRAMPFIMQEGTFFSAEVWNAVGGLDGTFHLAGDWDLWRRMAAVTEYFTINTVTGFHRVRLGQLSGEISYYHKEIDDRDISRTEILHPVEKMAHLIAYDSASAKWCTRTFDVDNRLPPTIIVGSRELESCACIPENGFLPQEGPYVEHDLPAGIRWLDGDRGTIRIVAPKAARYRVRLILRPSDSGLWIYISINGRSPFATMLSEPRAGVNQVIEFTSWLDEGVNVMAIGLKTNLAQSRRLLLVGCESVTQAKFSHRLGTPPVKMISRWLTVALIVRGGDDPDRLEATLASIVAQTDAKILTFVVIQPAPLTDMVLNDYREALTLVKVPISLNEDYPTEKTLRKCGFKFVLELAEGELLMAGGVNNALIVLELTSCEEALGMIEQRRPDGVVLRRLLPSSTHHSALRRLESKGISAPVQRFEIGNAIRAVTLDDDQLHSIDGPVLWVLDNDVSKAAAKPMFIFAAALTMLGVDARHLEVEDSALLPALIKENDEIIYADGLAVSGTFALPMSKALGTLVITTGVELGNVLVLPQAIDTLRLAPRNKAEARLRIGIQADVLLIIISEEIPAIIRNTLETLAQLDEVRPMAVINLSSGPRIVYKGRLRFYQLEWSIDLSLLSYFVSAADAALVPVGGMTQLSMTAWSCGIPVVNDIKGLHRTDSRTENLLHGLSEAFGPFGNANSIVMCDAAGARSLIEATCSIEALALRIRNSAAHLANLPRLKDWLEHRSYLGPSGTMVKSGPASGVSREPYRNHGFSVLEPISGCRFGRTIERCTAIELISTKAMLLLYVADPNITTLRLELLGSAGDIWTLRLNNEPPVDLRMESDGPTSSELNAILALGPHRLEVVCLSRRTMRGTRLVLTNWEVASERRVAQRDQLDLLLQRQPISGRETSTLKADGDWFCVSGFNELEPAFPSLALHGPFRWSSGPQCTIRLRLECGGPRFLSLAITNLIAGQRVRPVVHGVTYDWCAPLGGLIGRVEHRGWLIDWCTGDHDVTFELSQSQGDCPPTARPKGERDLGIILLALELELPSHYKANAAASLTF